MSESITTYTKDPDAILDYVWDWSSWLASGEVIITGTVIVPSGITLSSLSISTGTVTAWLSSGTSSILYRVVSRIQTNIGRYDDRSIFIFIEEK